MAAQKADVSHRRAPLADARICLLVMALLCQDGVCFYTPPASALLDLAAAGVRPLSCGRRAPAAHAAMKNVRMTATKPPTRGAAGDEVGAARAQGGEVCFDGGCVVEEDEDFLDELEKELRELSETEQRLRREGAMMVIEKLRSNEGLGGRLGSAGGRLGSMGASGGAMQPFSREAGESIIAQRLGGKTGPTVWSEFGALAASLKDKAINLGQGFPNWPPPEFVLNASMTAMMEGSHQVHSFSNVLYIE